VSFTDYAANAGPNWCPINVTTNWTGVIVPNYIGGPGSTPVGTVKMTMISDGTSNTLMLGEKFVSLEGYGSGLEYGDNENWTTSADWTTYRCANNPPMQDTNAATLKAAGLPGPPNSALPAGTTYKTFGCYYAGLGGLAQGAGNFDFWGSAHPGGFNVVFADGSVRSISYNITLANLIAIQGRNDGLVIDPSAIN
jgi:prepilin-type processing-associated H-X9-DG protein